VKKYRYTPLRVALFVVVAAYVASMAVASVLHDHGLVAEAIWRVDQRVFVGFCVAVIVYIVGGLLWQIFFASDPWL
jgi:hypothetical protein